MDEHAALALARATLAHALGRGPEPTPPAGAGLETRAGVFVTLHVAGELRGCIGTTEARAPLADVVPEMARAAAFEDPRFEPLAPEELDELTVELSILSEPADVTSEPVALAQAVRVGEHGLMVSSGGRRGLLLPQVATEHGMDAEAFLSATCRKAGLPEGAWRLVPETLRWRTFTVKLVR